MLTRRQLLARAAVASQASLLSNVNAWAALQTQLLQRAIPASGQMIPVIGSGSSGNFDVFPDTPEYAQMREVLEVFFGHGASVIDTSPNYSNSDAAIGQLLSEGGWRERTFLATKIAADSRAAAEKQWLRTEQRLRTDKVELLQIHNLRAWRKTLPVARELKAAGKTRYVGITHYRNHAHDDLVQIMRAEPLDFIQINYSVNSPEAAEKVLPMARDKGIAVMINRAFDDGRLFRAVKGKALPAWSAEANVKTWAQMFLKFAISHPAVTVVIPATSRPDRQADNLQGGIGPLLTDTQQQELIQMFG